MMMMMLCYINVERLSQLSLPHVLRTASLHVILTAGPAANAASAATAWRGIASTPGAQSELDCPESWLLDRLAVASQL